MDQDGLEETVGRCVGVFYADNDMIGSRDLEWQKHTMNVLVELFRMYSLAANIAKSQEMTCQPGALWAVILEEAMALKCTGVGDSYQVIIQRRIPCLEYEVELKAGYMTAHHRCMHRTEPKIDWS